MILRFSTLAAFFCFLPIVSLFSKSYDQTENIQARIKESDSIVGICIFEQEWLPIAPKYKHFEKPKYGKLTQWAVVTTSYKGEFRIGTKLEFVYFIEEPPTLFKKFRSTVEGEIRTLFFSKKDALPKNDGYFLETAHWGFDLDDSDFLTAFQRELKSNPSLKKESEQDAAANP